MTRKDYIEVARIIRDNLSTYQDASLEAHKATAKEFADWFRNENPRFDRDKFYRACGLPELADN